MKCPSCGAEIGSERECQYCGFHVTAEMKKEQEKENKEGCPKCGSTNIKFSRENVGAIKGKNGVRNINTTVGVCGDCGYTWNPTLKVATETVKKRKTWLWVLGWIFIFPLPLTLILRGKKDMKPALKYGIIALAWVVYLSLGIYGSREPGEQAVDTYKVTEIEETENTSNIKSAVVEEFINVYNAESSSPMDDIEQGNIYTKYYANSYGYHIEILEAADTKKLHITIFSEKDENADKGVSGMKDVFRDIVKVMNKVNESPVAYSDERINNYFDSMTAEKTMIMNDEGLNVDVSYVPDVEGQSRGYIEISAIEK